MMKNLIVICALGILAIASFFFLQELQNDLETKGVEKIEPIGTGYHVNMRIFNRKNQRTYEISSDKIVEFSHQHGTTFSQPFVLAWDDNNQLSWQGEAKKAFLSGDKNLLTMTQAVEVIQLPNTDRSTYLRGDKISYNVKESTLSSELPTQIDNGINQQTSDWLRVNTSTQYTIVKDNVKAHYQTEKTGK